MKKIYTILTLGICVILLQSGVKSVNNSSVPPAGYTGATGSYCVDCHGGFPLNSVGGGVTITGLPTAGYTNAGFYTFSIKINHGTTDRKRWGFSVKAVDANGNAVGTFNSNNTKAKRNANDQGELSHFGAATTSNANTFTYDNLTWVAPDPATTGPVTFYYVGNAANNLSGSAGDYIYSGSTVVGTLPIELKEFKAITENNNVILKWQTATEINSNYFDVERSDDGQFFFSLGKVNASGNSTLPISYSFTDTKATNNNGSQIFYRLKLVDKDGSVKYSNHLSVKPVISGVTIKNIYPTIIKKNDQVNVEIVSDKAKTMNITIMDESGRKLQQLSTNLITGNNPVKFIPKVDNLKGMLFIQFSTTNFQQTKTMVLQ